MTGVQTCALPISNPSDIKGTAEAFKRALDFKGPAVVVSKAPCILLENRTKRKAGKKIPTYAIDQEKCKQCNICIGKFGCPAFYYGENGTVHIDEQQCNGCGDCVQICPFDAISKKEEK